MRALLIALALLLAASWSAYAMLGASLSAHDMRQFKAGAQPVATFVLLNTASGKTTLNGGGSLQCNGC